MRGESPPWPYMRDIRTQIAKNKRWLLIPSPATRQWPLCRAPWAVPSPSPPPAPPWPGRPWPPARPGRGRLRRPARRTPRRRRPGTDFIKSDVATSKKRFSYVHHCSKVFNYMYSIHHCVPRFGYITSYQCSYIALYEICSWSPSYVATLMK